MKCMQYLIAVMLSDIFNLMQVNLIDLSFLGLHVIIPHLELTLQFDFLMFATQRNIKSIHDV